MHCRESRAHQLEVTFPAVSRRRRFRITPSRDPANGLQLATLPEHPESVPINALVAVAGTPLEGTPPVEALDLVRPALHLRLPKRPALSGLRCWASTQPESQ